MFSAPINVWAVVSAAVANLVIGWIWYGPLFGRKWMDLHGFTPESIGGGQVKALLTNFVSALITAYFLARIIGLTGNGGVASALWTAFWLWFGFILMFEILKIGFEKRKVSLVILETGFQLVWFLAAAIIIGNWR